MMLSHQSIFLPDDAFLFVCIRVIEAIDLTGLSPKEPMQSGTDLVISGLDGVALYTACLGEMLAPIHTETDLLWSIP